MQKQFDVTDVELLETMFSFTYTEDLICDSSKTRNYLTLRAQKVLNKPVVHSFNHWSEALFQSSIQNHRIPRLYIQKVNPLVGWGVYTQKTLPKYTYIGKYTGVIKKRPFFGDPKNNYVFGYVNGFRNTSYVIDAREKGNFTRFINHSYEPNLISRWMIHGDLCHIIFFTKQLVLRGEQLTYDYGPYYWKKRSYPQSL